MKGGLIGQLFRIFEINFLFVVAIFDLMHDVEAILHLPLLLTVSGNMSDACETANLYGYHSYFRKDFKMLLAINMCHIQRPHRALGQT